MSTTLANPTKRIRQGAPRLIRSDEQLAEYTEALFALTAKAAPTPDEEEAIELLTLLIDRYESERYPLPDASPVEVLRFLLDRTASRNATLRQNSEARAPFPWCYLEDVS